MEWIILGIVIGIIVGIPLVIYFVLAPRNRWFTFVKEGTVKIVVRGDAFEKTLIQWKDYTLSYQKEQLEEEKKWEVIKGTEPRHLFGGLRLYSWLHPLFDVYIYRHRWTHLHEDGSIHAHDELLDFVLLKEDLYVIEMSLREEGGAEDINGVPMGIKLALPMRIVNPYVAVFRVRRWLPMITGVIQARFRRFVTNYRYKEDLLNMRAGVNIEKLQEDAGIPEGEWDKEGTDLWKKFWTQTEKDFEDEGGQVEVDGEKKFIQIYGVVINEKGARILEINPSPNYRKFTTMKYETEQEKERTIIQAEAEKKRLETVAQGEKIRIETVYGEIQKLGDLGRLVRSLEAMEKSSLAASITVQAVPGIQEVLRGVFGRPLETVTPQEFRELREMVERLIKEKEGK